MAYGYEKDHQAMTWLNCDTDQQASSIKIIADSDYFLSMRS